MNLNHTQTVNFNQHKATLYSFDKKVKLTTHRQSYSSISNPPVEEFPQAPFHSPSINKPQSANMNSYISINALIKMPS